MAPKIAVSILFGALLAGCAARYTPTPLATNFPVSEQYTLQAAAHWGAIAGHIGTRLDDDIRKAPQRPIHVVEPSSTASPFERALAAHITSGLVRSGYVVSRTEAGSLKVEIDVQPLVFRPDREQTRFIGVATTLVPGVWALPTLGVAGTSLALAGAHDIHQIRTAKFTDGATPKTELIVTVSVSDQYRYYARNSTAYYVAEDDRKLYGIPEDPQPGLALKNYQVKGDK